MQISQKAINHIIAEEVSSPAYYEKHYRRPEWPGGASGVTVGNGYDLGYASRDKIQKDFGGRLPETMVAVMKSCSGVKGSAAAAMLRSVKNQIDVPWSVAYAVFMERDVPQWTATVRNAVGLNFEKMTPTCAGVEVGLAYNRGAGGFNAAGDRYKEMREIKACIQSMNFPAIPVWHERMARLWEGTSVSGVAGRRRREAALFREGLKENVSAPKSVTIVPKEPEPEVIASNRPDQTARTPQPKTTPAQNTTTGTTALGPPAAAASAGWSKEAVIGTAFASIAVAILVFVIWYRNRNPHGGFEPA